MKLATLISRASEAREVAQNANTFYLRESLRADMAETRDDTDEES